jgi:hypothetical protein
MCFTQKLVLSFVVAQTVPLMIHLFFLTLGLSASSQKQIATLFSLTHHHHPMHCPCQTFAKRRKMEKVERQRRFQMATNVKKKNISDFAVSLQPQI